MKNKILVLSFSLLAFSSSQALAVGYAQDGFVDAYADLSWDGLSVTSIGGTLEAYDSYSYSQAKTADYYDIFAQPALVYQYVDDSPDSSAESIISSPSNGGFEYARSNGETAQDAITSRSTVQLLPGSDGAYSAEARAQQGVSYAVLTAGVFTFSIPYYLEVIVHDLNDDNTEAADVQAWSWLSLHNGSDWSVIDGTYRNATSGTGILSFTYAAAEGSFLKFEAGADSRVQLLNPVPVPPSVLMLLTGCTSLFFLKRRKG